MEEAKQKAEKLQGGNRQVTDRIRRAGGALCQALGSCHTSPETPYVRLSRPFWKSRSPASHRTVGNGFQRPFQLAGGGNAHTDVDRCARRHRFAAGRREGHIGRGNGRRLGFRAFSGRFTSSKRGWFSHLKRHINTVYCACSVQAASGKGPSLESLAKTLIGEGLQVASPNRKHPG